MPPPPRVVRLVLVRPSGEPIGVLPEFAVDVPWWQEAGPVVRGARERFGIDIIVLRLLAAAEPTPHGGLVTYLAETAAPPAGLQPWQGVLDEHPRRMPWARPGGPGADLEWADDRLRDAGVHRAGPAEQVRTWNLSSLWRLPLPGGTSAWLKHVPPFFAHEGRVLSRLAGGPVPALLAHDRGRVLMPEIAGEDLYDASLRQLEEMVRTLVSLQASWIGQADELLALGLPDWRHPALATAIADAIARTADVSGRDRAVLDAFVADLPERVRQVADAGVPDTLVHGDFHPGNVRGHGTTITLLDWGDCGVGHPLLDQAAFLDRIPPDAVVPIRALWREEWERVVPGSEPDRAAELLAPVAAARQAVIYRRFLDGIEPSEHPYHAADPADWLARSARLLVTA